MCCHNHVSEKLLRGKKLLPTRRKTFLKKSVVFRNGGKNKATFQILFSWVTARILLEGCRKLQRSHKIYIFSFILRSVT
eukprot:UN22419